MTARTLPVPNQDMHVHSTFSDGAGTVEENVATAERLGLERLTCVDHVRAGTDWAPDFVREVRRVAAGTDIELCCALEAKILDTSGALDLPEDTGEADYLYAADHQVALADGPANPRSVREAIEAGELEAAAVVEAIVESTVNAVGSRDGVVIAHLFSVLPKIGVDEGSAPIEAIERLADAAVAAGARVEIDERWRCPSARTLRPFHEAGVPILLSTDSHKPETIGRYEYCLEVIGELANGTPR